MSNICRSHLFAPGSRPEIFDKTPVAAADLVAIDLEDAMAPALMAEARIVGSDTDYARLLGFSGKTVLHPSNVATVNDAFSPIDAEIEEAKAIIAAFEASETGVAELDGKPVEAPIVKSMRNVLALAAAKSRG